MAGPMKMQPGTTTLCLVFVLAAMAVPSAYATLTLIRIQDSMPGPAAVSSVSISCTLTSGTNTYNLGTKVLTPGTFDDVLFQNAVSGPQKVSCNFIWMNAALRNPSIPAIIWDASKPGPMLTCAANCTWSLRGDGLYFGDSIYMYWNID